MNCMQKWYEREVARIGLIQTIQAEIPKIPGYACVIPLKSDGEDHMFQIKEYMLNVVNWCI
ncbi:MAG: hypothetical protein QXZ43_01390 [Candidatus Aenigmatarchaeota archaeon]